MRLTIEWEGKMEETVEKLQPFMTVVVADEEVQEEVIRLAEENGFTVDAFEGDVTSEDEQILTLLGAYAALKLFAEFLRGVEGIGKIKVYDEVPL